MLIGWVPLGSVMSLCAALGALAGSMRPMTLQSSLENQMPPSRRGRHAGGLAAGAEDPGRDRAERRGHRRAAEAVGRAAGEPEVAAAVERRVDEAGVAAAGNRATEPSGATRSMVAPPSSSTHMAPSGACAMPEGCEPEGSGYSVTPALATAGRASRAIAASPMTRRRIDPVWVRWRVLGATSCDNAPAAQILHGSDSCSLDCFEISDHSSLSGFEPIGRCARMAPRRWAGDLPDWVAKLDESWSRTGRRRRGYTRLRAVGVAQLVELLVVVQAVAGSSPVAHPSETPAKAGVCAFRRRSAGADSPQIPPPIAPSA